MLKRIFGHTWTAKAQISLRANAGATKMRLGLQGRKLESFLIEVHAFTRQCVYAYRWISEWVQDEAFVKTFPIFQLE